MRPTGEPAPSSGLTMTTAAPAGPASPGLHARLERLKQADASDHGFPRPIVGNGGIIGQMRPLTYADANDEQLVSRLQTWRNRHRAAFFSQFEATREGTRQWLTKGILDRPDRILFLMSDAMARPIGHFGISNVCRESAELDALVRGEPRCERDFMLFAGGMLIDWTLAELGVTTLYARIFADNTLCIRVCLRLGLQICARETFRVVSEEGMVRHEPMGQLQPGDGREVVRLELTREHYLANGPAWSRS